MISCHELCPIQGPMCLKALANEDTLLRTQMFPHLPARATFVADTNFVSTTNVSQFAQPKKQHGQQCVRNNVSLFARPLLKNLPS